MQPTHKQHLVIGASGKTGSRVMAALKSQGYQPIGASRSGDVHFDWQTPSTWAQALEGVDAVYLTYYPDLAAPSAPEAISRFCAMAKIKGVKHITLLSGRGEPAAQVCENIVKQLDMDWTIVRASWFNQNFSEGLFKQFIINGNIALPVSIVKEPFVDVDDIADVVVASLTEDGHSGKLYEVTGPELLSFAQLAVRFSKLLNKPVQFEQISIEQFRCRLQQAQLHEPEIEALIYLFTEVLDGRNETLATGIQQALGRTPKYFNQFILDNLKHFREVA